LRYRKEWLEDVQNILAGEFDEKHDWHEYFLDGLTPREAVLEYMDKE
jgi:hypothetical protein